jgi:hypothetical protein
MRAADMLNEDVSLEVERGSRPFASGTNEEGVRPDRAFLIAVGHQPPPTLVAERICR